MSELLTSLGNGLGNGRIVIVLAPDGRSALIKDPIDDTASLYDLPSLIRNGKPLNHRSRVTGLALTPDGRRAATCCQDGSLWTWDMASRRPLSPALHIGAAVEWLSFTPDGMRIIARCTDHTVRIVTPPEPEAGSFAQARHRPRRAPGLPSRQNIPWSRSAARQPNNSRVRTV